DPRAAGELEVFGDSPVEAQAASGVTLVQQTRSIAEFVEAFLIEGRSGQVRPTPVSRRHARALDAQFELVLVGRKLDDVAGSWQSDDAGANAIRRREGNGGAGLGRAKTGQHRYSDSSLCNRKLCEGVHGVLSERAAAEEAGTQTTEERAAQLAILAQVMRERIEAPRHVELHRGRDLSQISQGRRDSGRRR